MKKLIKLIGYMLYVLLVLFLVWFAISYFEVLANNLGEPSYSKWNLLTLLIQ